MTANTRGAVTSSTVGQGGTAMVNGRLIVAVLVAAVDRVRIEQTLSGNEFEFCLARAGRHHRTIEA